MMRLEKNLYRNFLNATAIIVSTLIFVWPLSGTITLRLVLLLLLFLFTSVLCNRAICSSFIQHIVSKKQFKVLLILTLAVLLSTTLNSESNTIANIKVFASQWMVGVSCFVIGCFLAIIAHEHECLEKILFTGIFISMLLQVILSDLFGVAYTFYYQIYPYRQASFLDIVPNIYQVIYSNNWSLLINSTGAPDKMSYICNILMAITIPEIISRHFANRNINASNFIVFSAVFFVLIAMFWLKIRNGNVSLILIFTLCIAAYKSKISLNIFVKNSRLKYYILAVFVLCATFVINDKRWEKLGETAKVVITNDDLKWTEPRESWPKLNGGENVDVSAFERFSWIKIGLKLSLDNPFGVGYSKSSFGTALQSSYEGVAQFKDYHSHSGIIDFLLSNGYIPTFLLIVFFCMMLQFAAAGFKDGNIFLGLSLLCIVSDYLLRSIVDSILRDHMLHEFLFITGILFAALCLHSRNRCDKL